MSTAPIKVCGCQEMTLSCNDYLIQTQNYQLNAMIPHFMQLCHSLHALRACMLLCDLYSVQYPIRPCPCRLLGIGNLSW